MRPADFRVDVRQSREATIVAVTGELDLATVDAVREALVRHGRPTSLVLDLSGLSFMDRAGAALLVEQQRRAEREGIDFRVVRRPPPVQRHLEVAGVGRHLRYAEDVTQTSVNG